MQLLYSTPWFKKLKLLTAEERKVTLVQNSNEAMLCNASSGPGWLSGKVCDL